MREESSSYLIVLKLLPQFTPERNFSGVKLKKSDIHIYKVFPKHPISTRSPEDILSYFLLKALLVCLLYLCLKFNFCIWGGEGIKSYNLPYGHPILRAPVMKYSPFPNALLYLLCHQASVCAQICFWDLWYTDLFASVSKPHFLNSRYITISLDVL